MSGLRTAAACFGYALESILKPGETLRYLQLSVADGYEPARLYISVLKIAANNFSNTTFHAGEFHNSGIGRPWDYVRSLSYLIPGLTRQLAMQHNAAATMQDIGGGMLTSFVDVSASTPYKEITRVIIRMVADGYDDDDDNKPSQFIAANFVSAVSDGVANALYPRVFKSNIYFGPVFTTCRSSQDHATSVTMAMLLPNLKRMIAASTVTLPESVNARLVKGSLGISQIVHNYVDEQARDYALLALPGTLMNDETGVPLRSTLLYMVRGINRTVLWAKEVPAHQVMVSQSSDDGSIWMACLHDASFETGFLSVATLDIASGDIVTSATVQDEIFKTGSRLTDFSDYAAGKFSLGLSHNDEGIVHMLKVNVGGIQPEIFDAAMVVSPTNPGNISSGFAGMTIQNELYAGINTAERATAFAVDAVKSPSPAFGMSTIEMQKMHRQLEQASRSIPFASSDLPMIKAVDSFPVDMNETVDFIDSTKAFANEPMCTMPDIVKPDLPLIAQTSESIGDTRLKIAFCFGVALAAGILFKVLCSKERKKTPRACCMFGRPQDPDAGTELAPLNSRRKDGACSSVYGAGS